MFKLIKQFKREFVYCAYLFLVLELLVTRQYVYNLPAYVLTSAVGAGLLVTWLTSTLQLFSKRRVSSKSSTHAEVDLKRRAFSYVVLPFVLWFALSVFLLFNENTYINQLVIVSGVSMYFALMLQIRGSFEKLYSVDIHTRYVYDLINIAVFYLFTSVLQRLGLDIIISSVIVTVFTFIALTHTLYTHRKLEENTVVVALVVGTGIGVLHYLLRNTNIYILPGIVSIIYYLVLSLWNVRFAGARKLEDFIPPLMYSLMALILVLSL